MAKCFLINTQNLEVIKEKNYKPLQKLTLAKKLNKLTIFKFKRQMKNWEISFEMHMTNKEKIFLIYRNSEIEK